MPDLIGLVREPYVLCSSTTPTLPYGLGTTAEHLAMALLNHGGTPWLPADVALVRERIHPATMAAEGPLHELGAIGIVNSDSQGMGRIGEVLRRTLQLAHVMKGWRATEAGSAWPDLPDDGSDPFDDNARILRYLAKVTIEPAIVHGLSDEVGSLRPGRLADIVLWKPGFFGVKPEAVIKAGASRPGARSARATPASSARSRRATSPTGPVMAWRRRMSGSPSCRLRRWTGGSLGASAPVAGSWPCTAAGASPGHRSGRTGRRRRSMSTRTTGP